MPARVIETIRSRSREEYGHLYTDLYNYYREIAQENGEIALLVGIAFGIVFVVFFKFMVTAAVIIALIANFIYLIAVPEAEMRIDPVETAPENGHVSESLSKEETTAADSQHFN